MKVEYYTPTKEEFHSGFEYEVFQRGQPYNPNFMYLMPPQTEDEWYQFKFPDPFLGYHLDKIFDKYTIRVKKLNYQDVQKLLNIEVKKGGSYFFEEECMYRPDFIIGSHITKRRMAVTLDQRVTIWYYLDTGWEKFFEGVVMNISELKRILKQVGWELKK